VAAKVLITMPLTAKRGELIEIRTLIAHPMETGYRVDARGRTVPRDLLRRFSCRLDGETVFAAELHAAIAANPYIAFGLVASTSGSLVFQWEGDNGFSHTETRTLTVA
jgi:sulfur-oxidizing protein SoxZ